MSGPIPLDRAERWSRSTRRRAIPAGLGGLNTCELADRPAARLSGHPRLDHGTDGDVWRVTDLGLYHNQLDGPIPPELVRLSNLRELHLGDNQLDGPIPSELGGLTNLRELYLYFNELSGPIPAELGGLTNLRELISTSTS